MHVHFKVHGTGKKNLHGDGIALWYTRDRLVPGGEVHTEVDLAGPPKSGVGMGMASSWPVATLHILLEAAVLALEEGQVVLHCSTTPPF